MCNYFFIWAACVLMIWHLMFLYMRGKYEETTIPPWIIPFHFASLGRRFALRDTRGRRTRTHALNMFMWSEPGAAIKHNHRRVNVCTPTSLALVRASFRATTNNDRGEREEDGGKRRSKRGGIGKESVREIDEGGRREEGGLGITSANHSSRETGDELQKWDLRQMPSFSKEQREWLCPPGEHSD